MRLNGALSKMAPDICRIPKFIKQTCIIHKKKTQDWLVGLGLTALWEDISVYIGPSPKESEKEDRKDRWE